MSEKVDQNSQSLNHFISNSPWGFNNLFSKIASYFVKMLPTFWLDDLCLAIDESSFPKKGNKSVGVAHQYCGQLGKIANCQVGVFASLICRNLYCLIFAMLYLPKKWCKTKDSNIPKERKEYKSKIDLALEIILHVKSVLKIPFKWVCFDSFYGRDTELLFTLNQSQIKFVADIPKDTNIYLKEPKLYLPVKKGKRGRKTTRYAVKGRTSKVSNIALKVKNSQYTEIQLRENSDGKKIKARFYICQSYIILKSKGLVMEVVLIIRKDEDGSVKYALSNAIEESLERLAYMHGQRYFIERSFQEAKQQLGMREYQVRGYEGWHKHMAMISLAMLFLQLEKKKYMDLDLIPSIPLLAEIVKILIPQKILSLNDLLTKVRNTHSKQYKTMKNNKNKVT
jgi:SRSO17 transposase